MIAPKLRFKSFNNEWKKYYLSDILNLLGGNAFSSKDTSKNGVKWLKIANVGFGKVNWNVTDYLPFNFLDKYPNYSLEDGDIILTLTRPILNKNLKIAQITTADLPALLNQRVAKLIVNEEMADKKFLFQLLRNRKTVLDIESSISGTDPPNLGNNELKKIQIFIPSKSEGINIAFFFDRIDQKIKFHQEKIDLLKKQKKGYMQKIFSQELRFKGFIEKWKQTPLENVANFYDNLRVPITSINRVKGNIPYYGANGIQDYVEGFTHDGEFVLIAEDGASDLINYPVNYVNGKVWVNNHAHVVSGKSGELDTLFLASRIKNMNITPWLVGGGRAKLNGEVLKKIPISYPSFEEQQKIGEFFNMYDYKIKLQQQKLNLLQQQKQAFMQQMFI